MQLRPKTAADRVIVALDVPDVEKARELVARTRPVVSFYKVGMQLIYAGGVEFARELAGAGLNVFLDAKLLDIDNTVEKAVDSVARLGVTLLTVHAYPKALRAAVRGRGDRPLGLLGVTVLTSMDDADVAAAGYPVAARDLVLARARDCEAAGVTGVVCSPEEIAPLRRSLAPETLIVTPGIRPAGADRGDQRRVMTPGEAMRDGADYIVVGRPITAAPDPEAAAAAIVAEVETARPG